MMDYYALLLTIFCIIWPVGLCVSENEKNINSRTISGTLRYAWLVPVCVHVADLDLHTSNVIDYVTKIPERTKKRCFRVVY